MNTVFSIVAKNYLPLAFALGQTIKKNCPGVSYSILLADDVEGLDHLDEQPFKIHTLDVLDIEDINVMAFKYNVTEFCTAVKPYYIDFLFKKGYEKVIYFDPDICVFSSLQNIYDELENASIIVTPHFITPETAYSGTITESLLLHVGTFNLGFIAVANTIAGRKFVEWWKSRLYSQCYQDKIEALHTDQKWIDLAPSFFGESLNISRDIGRNMAFWNLHERRLTGSVEGDWKVENRFDQQVTSLTFFHFAGFDINNCQSVIHKNHPEYTMEDFPELKEFFDSYKKLLKSNGFDKFIKLPYGFGRFRNGAIITNFQRRLFRRALEEGVIFEHPFEVNNSSFYATLKKHDLISKSSTNIDKLNNRNYESFSSKIKLLNFLMLTVKKILGFDNYSLLLKFCQRYFRPENQIFLISRFRNSYTFKNENQK
ncbi:MAG: hypothetical protein JWQ40_2957 [Segetibacter sp.]|nr:hypothetical protein [Segetibacter sp.]